MKKKDRSKKRKKKRFLDKEVDALANKSSTTIYGMNMGLDNESDQVKDIIRQTMNATSSKYGNRANGQVVNYFQ